MTASGFRLTLLGTGVPITSPDRCRCSGAPTR
jgi:hypothetical protein